MHLIIFCYRIAVKYLTEARQKFQEDPEMLAIQEPFLFHLLDNKNLSETEINLLVTEIFQGGIDAVIKKYKNLFSNIFNIFFHELQL